MNAIVLVCNHLHVNVSLSIFCCSFFNLVLGLDQVIKICVFVFYNLVLAFISIFNLILARDYLQVLNLFLVVLNMGLMVFNLILMI